MTLVPVPPLGTEGGGKAGEAAGETLRPADELVKGQFHQ